MSALRQPVNNRAAFAGRAARPARAVNEVTLLRLVQDARSTSHPLYAVTKIVVIGTLIISGLSLLLNILTSQGVYDLADLKNQKKELTITSQILSEQVDSLSSDQNLSSAAAQLGMVANSNPVFLRVADQKIFGKPKAAVADSSSFIRAALVPNAAQVRHTNVQALLEQAAAAKASKSAADALAAAAAAQRATATSKFQETKSGFKAAGSGTTSNVANQKSSAPKVPLNTGGIPASPTN